MGGRYSFSAFLRSDRYVKAPVFTPRPNGNLLSNTSMEATFADSQSRLSVTANRTSEIFLTTGNNKSSLTRNIYAHTHTIGANVVHV